MILCVILSSDRSLCNFSKYWCFKCWYLLMMKGLHTCHHPWALWWWTVVSLLGRFWGTNPSCARSSSIWSLFIHHSSAASPPWAGSQCFLCCHSFRSWQFVILKKWWESVSDFTEPGSFLLDKCVYWVAVLGLVWHVVRVGCFIALMQLFMWMLFWHLLVDYFCFAANAIGNCLTALQCLSCLVCIELLSTVL